MEKILTPPAFLTTLRSNLALSASEPSPYNSLTSTPIAANFNLAPRSQPAPSKLSISTSAFDFYDDPKPEPEPLPTLTTTVAGPDHVEDRSAALGLIAQSVKEQRWTNAKAAVLHPTSIAGIVVALGLLMKAFSPPLLTLLIASSAVFGLMALYWVTMDYGYLALAIDWDWFDYAKKTGNAHGGRGEDSIVLVSRWGEEIIAAVVLRVVKRERKGYVKAWTVEKGYRGNGVGAGLMEEAVRVAWGKGARTMVFETDHASEYTGISIWSFVLTVAVRRFSPRTSTNV